MWLGKLPWGVLTVLQMCIHSGIAGSDGSPSFWLLGDFALRGYTPPAVHKRPFVPNFNQLLPLIWVVCHSVGGGGGTTFGTGSILLRVMGLKSSHACTASVRTMEASSWSFFVIFMIISVMGDETAVFRLHVPD